MYLLYLPVLLWTLNASASAIQKSLPGWAHTETIPALQANVSSIAKFTADSIGMDEPHVHPINETSYEWFYFDAVSNDGKYSVVVVFYTAPETGFMGGGPAYNILPVSIHTSIPGKDDFYSDRRYAKEAVVNSVGNGANGQWVGTGMSFTGKADLSHYTIKVDTEDVKGCVEFKAIAPAHYACGPVELGQSMEALPHLAWAIGISDSIATVDLMVNGTKVKFTGVGYHDKNWGDIPFNAVVQKSIWGHGRLGPYSIVWSEVTHRATGKLYTAGYVAFDGKVLTYGCTGFKVTPFPIENYGAYHVEIDLGNKGIFEFDITEVAVIDGEDGQNYARRTGLLSGGIKGGKIYKGATVYEHFSLD